MIQKTYAQINREIQALQAHAEKLRAAELQAIISKLNETIAKHGLKAEDLRFAGAGSTSGAPVRATRQAALSASRSASIPSGAKYGDDRGNTWGGRGPRPAWLRDALSKGRTLESFAVSGNESSDPAPAAQRSARGEAKTKAQSIAAKSPLPALYSHPKTGQTWSGRGPKPAWLKQGLKKRGASLNDFLISARESGENAAEAAGPASATPSSSKTSRPGKPAAAPQSNGSKKKSLAEKISLRTKASSAAAVRPNAAPAPTASPAPVVAAKKAAGKKAAAKKSSEENPAPASAKTAAKTAIKKSGTALASQPPDAPPSTTAAASAKKAASESPAISASKRATKSSAKKTGAASKRIASSMAPPVDDQTTSKTDAGAAQQVAQESGSTEGQASSPGI